MPLDKFSGPGELSPVWDEFIARYTDKGSSGARVAEANLFNELLATETTPREFLAKHAAIGFSALKKAIDDICQAQSSESTVEGSPERILNDYVVTQLVLKWIGILTDNGLYPPPESDNVSNDIKASRDRIRKGESVGGLLSSAIASTCLSAIGGAVGTARNRLAFAEGADLSIVDSEAPIIFHNTLFIFDDTKRDQALSTGVRFKLHLRGRIIKISTNKVLKSITGTLSFDQPSGSGDDRTLHDKKADDLAVDPSVAAEDKEQLEIALKTIKELDERERQVIEMRFGLGKYEKPHKFNKIAEALGITPERVRQLLEKVLRNIRSRAGEDEELPSADKERAVPAPVVAAAPALPFPGYTEYLATPDYPYASLIPVAGGVSAEQRRDAESKHVTDILAAGMLATWSAKSRFYDDVFAQWQAILATRKSIAGAGLFDHGEIRRAVVELMKSLITHAPDISHASAILDPQAASSSTDRLSYNAVFERFERVDFHQPQKMAEGLVYDPRWRPEVAGYLARVPSTLLSAQLHEIYKPVYFEKYAEFGECLEAYVFCGGRDSKEFLQLYCYANPNERAKALDDGRLIASAKKLAKEINNSGNQTIKFNTIQRWMDKKRPIGLSPKHREIISLRYSLTDQQRKCLDFINKAIANLDTAEAIVNREEEKLRSDHSTSTSLTALAVLKGLIAIQPDLTPEGLSNKIGGIIGPTAFQKWVKKNRITTDVLLPYIDEVSLALVPGNAALARRAANLLLGLPSSQEMTFREAIAFAREQGYTLDEFMDMRRYQLRDDAKLWRATHAYDPAQAFTDFLLFEKPSEIRLTRRIIRTMRQTDNEAWPEPPVLDFIAWKLGAHKDDDKNIPDANDQKTFRQLIYAHPLDSGQNKVDGILDLLETAQSDIYIRRKMIDKLFDAIQERDGIRYRIELSRNILAYAKSNGLLAPDDKMTVEMLNRSLWRLASESGSVSQKADIIAAYAFKEDSGGHKARLGQILAVAEVSHDIPDVTNDQMNTALSALLESSNASQAREKFDLLLDIVEKREGLRSRGQLAIAVLSYAERNGIVPDSGKVTEYSISKTIDEIFEKMVKVESSVRAKAIASFICQNDDIRQEALEALLNNGIAASQSFAVDVEVARARASSINEVK